MPPHKKTGTLFTRRRREILAVIGGAVAALGLWLFIGGPHRVMLGTGTFSSPDEPGEDARVAVGDSAAPATPVDSAPEGAAGIGEEATAGAADDAAPDEAAATARTARQPAASETAPEEPPIGRARQPAASETAPRTDPAAERAASPPAGRDARLAAPAPARDAGADRGAGDSVPATAVEARVAAEVAVARYMRAIESGDLEALRLAHPGLTAGTAAAWRRVFENGETFVALLRIAGFGTNGTEARAEVRGSCHFYDLSLRRFVDVPVEFELFLHHDGHTWRPVLASSRSPDSAP